MKENQVRLMVYPASGFFSGEDIICIHEVKHLPDTKVAW